MNSHWVTHWNGFNGCHFLGHNGSHKHLADWLLQSMHKGQLYQPDDYHLIKSGFHSFFNCGLLHTARPAVGGNIKKTWGFCQFINFAGPPMFYCPHNLLILPVWGTPITVWRPVGTLNVKVWNHPPLRVHLTVIQTRLHTDWSGVVSSASGPNHPSEDLHSIGSNVPSSTDGLLPNHRTI